MAVHDMDAQSYPFRPGSGASVLQPSSQARATALTLGSLPEPLRVKAGSQPLSASGTPLLSVRTVARVATAALAFIRISAIGLMMHRHGGGSHHHSCGHRPLGSARIPANHIGKIPPTNDPRFEHKYSFRQFTKEMQHWILVTDLPPHQQAVMILRNLDGAAYDLISQMPPNELYAGANVNGTHLDPAANILFKLHHRFAQQDIVTRMSAMSEVLSFRRQDREGIQSTLTRFEVIRN